MKKKSICLVPKAASLGGPRTFQQNLIAWAEQSEEVEVHFDADREDIDAFLVIGGPKKYLGRLLKARRQGIPVVQRLNGMNWIHRRRKTGLVYYLHSEAANLAIAFFRRFEEAAERFGVDLLIENSASAWNPEYYLRTGREMLEFVRLAGIERLHICWDIGHANVQGRNQYDDITAMGAELRALHVQDNYGDADSHVMPLVGTTNFDQVLRGLTDAGYKGDFTFEGGCTLRRRADWPHYRRDVTDLDRLADPPLAIQIKQIGVMYEIGKWMLESYGIPVE